MGKNGVLSLWITNIGGGIVVAAAGVMFAVSIAAMVFSGPLQPFMPVGIGMVLMGFVIPGTIVAWRSSFPGTIAGGRSSLTPVFALLASGVATALIESGRHGAILPTLVATIAVAALATGAFLWLLGRFRLGGLVRYVPYPVMGGFFAGIGLLLLSGSVSLMSQTPRGPDLWSRLFDAEMLLLWGPGMAFALVLLAAERMKAHWAVMPGLLLVGTVLFYLLLGGAGVSTDEARSLGLMLDLGGSQAFWPPVSLGELGAVQWDVVAGEAGVIAVVMLISVISLLLDASGIELLTRRDMDLDHELRVAGWANVATAGTGGFVGVQVAADTALSYKLGAEHRISGLAYAALCLLAVVFGPDFVGYFPIPVIGGLLAYLGMSFLFDWLVDGWKRLPPIDYGLVVLILVIINAEGLLAGVGVGVMSAALLFVFNYSRLDVVKHELLADDHRSNVERSKAEKAVLADGGDQAVILILQGYLFFGTASKLVERVKTILTAPRKSPVRFIVLDLREVGHMDTSAAYGLKKLTQIAETQGIVLVLTNTGAELMDELRRARVLVDDASHNVKLFRDLDAGVEWCEDRIIERDAFADGLDDFMMPAAFAAGESIPSELYPHMEKIGLSAGTMLFRQGDHPNGMYMVHSGQVSVFLELGGGETRRLRRFGPGSLVGEMGLYSNAVRTASAVMEEDGIVYHLPWDVFETLQRQEPRMMSTLHAYVVRMLAERLSHANREISNLLGG